MMYMYMYLCVPYNTVFSILNLFLFSIPLSTFLLPVTDVPQRNYQNDGERYLS